MQTEYNPGNPGATLSQLRLDGYRVFASHRRPMKNIETPYLMFSHHEMKNMGFNLSEDWAVRGGQTTVHIYLGDTLLGYGEARCCDKDPFNKKRGLIIALGRALAETNL